MERNQYRQIVQYLLNQEIPEDRKTKAQQRQWINMYKKFQLVEEKLFKLNKWKEKTKVLQQGETEAIIFLYHNDPIAGHFGLAKILGKIKLQYYWSKMYDEIKRYVESCHICQMQD